jgi:purine catabolism regulator
VDGLTVREMLGQDAMRGTRIIAGAGGLDRVVRRLNVMTVPNIVRWTKRDEFLLTTGYPLPREPGEFGRLIEQLAANGLAGLGVKLDEYLAEVPADAVRLADRAAFPIVVIPHSSPLDDVLSQTFETIVNRQATALARRQQIHDAFLRVALTGGGLARLARELAGILPGADVVICDPAGYPLAAATGSGADGNPAFPDAGGRVGVSWLTAGVHTDAATGTPWAAALIRAGELRHGWVIAAGGGAQGLPAVAGLAVEQAALVAALEITRDLAVLAVEQQFASNALHDLVTGAAADVDQALERAARFGWNLRRPLAVLVARDCGQEPGDEPSRTQEAALRAVELWTRAVRDRDRGAAVAGFATELVAVVGATDAGALARKVRADMGAAGRPCSVGVSQDGAGPPDIPRLYEEARVALHVGLRIGGNGAVTSFAGLGLYRLISNVSQGELRAFVYDTLGPVLDLPEPVRSDLLKSLAVLAGTRYNVAESARVLHYHYNTMRYRVTKLERLLGEFAGDAAATLRIGVALEILRMYEISGDAIQPLR